MPWTEESPLGAAMGFAGGFLQGKTQAKQYQDTLEQQKRSDALQAQALGIRSQYDQLLGNAATVRAQTGQDTQLEKVRHDKATEAGNARNAANQVAWHKYLQTKDAKSFKLAQERIDNAWRETTAKIAAAKDIKQMGDDTALGVAKIHAAASITTTGMRDDTQVQTAGMHIQAQQGLHDDSESQATIRQMRGENAAAARAGKDQPYPGLDGFETNLAKFYQQVQANPKTLPGILKQLHASAVAPQLKAFAERTLIRAAGGSQANQNPPPASLWP